MRSRIAIGIICFAVLAAAGSSDGVYTGTRVLTKGPISAGCPATEDVSATIAGRSITITNSQLRNFPMDFEPNPDGSFAEISINMGGATVDIHGRITGTGI
jgi:hypothetical protein